MYGIYADANFGCASYALDIKPLVDYARVKPLVDLFHGLERLVLYVGGKLCGSVRCLNQLAHLPLVGHQAHCGRDSWLGAASAVCGRRLPGRVGRAPRIRRAHGHSRRADAHGPGNVPGNGPSRAAGESLLRQPLIFLIYGQGRVVRVFCTHGPLRHADADGPRHVPGDGPPRAAGVHIMM